MYHSGGDVDNGGSLAYAEAWRTWEVSVHFTQFCCETKYSKNIVYQKYFYIDRNLFNLFCFKKVSFTNSDILASTPTNSNDLTLNVIMIIYTQPQTLNCIPLSHLGGQILMYRVNSIYGKLP